MSSKTILQFTPLCSSSKTSPQKQKKKERKKASWGLFKHNTSFFSPKNRIQNIYNTISNYCTEPRRSNRHCLCLFLSGGRGDNVSLFTEMLHLNPLNCLLDVFQQSFVFRALVLLLVCVDIGQSRDVGVKVLVTQWLLQEQTKNLLVIHLLSPKGLYQTHGHG